ncbi:unnamed protein product [Larinioides sclopetarius]|uniref:Uncharacterized protein n=1 Tax=Larinioides sclopetarius TaxID=280406 RepID=A0AAV2A976_9ARAC
MDLKLCEFYFETISKLIGKENRRENLKQIKLYLNRFPSSPDSSNFNSKTRKGKERRLLRETLCYRIAYIYRNSLCISSAVAHHFEKVLNQNKSHLSELGQKNRTFRICSLGGGSPSDVIALIKVLEANLVARMSGDIQVTIVDMNGNWKSTCISILQCLERFKHPEPKISFIEADISAFGEEVTNAIKNAHIVSMVKFISESQGGTRKKMAQFRKNLKICELVQPGSLFLLLDCPQNGLVDICGGDTGLIPESRTVCNEPEHSHKLDSAALERHARFFDKLFRSANYSSSLELFVRVWIKTERPPLTDSVFLKALCEKYEDFKRRLIWKKKAQTNQTTDQLRRSRDARNWKQLFSAEMKDIGWNRKKIRKAITTVEREVVEKFKK